MDSSFGSVVCLGVSEEIYHGQMKKRVPGRVHIFSVLHGHRISRYTDTTQVTITDTNIHVSLSQLSVYCMIIWIVFLSKHTSISSVIHLERNHILSNPND